MRGRILSGLIATGLMVGGAAMAAAQGDADYSRPGPYVGLGFSYSKEAFNVSDVEDDLSDTISAPLKASNSCNNPAPADGQPCELHVLVDRTDSLGGDFRAGYRLNSWAAVEANFQYYDNYDLKLGGAAEDFADIRMYDFFVNGKFYPMGGSLQPYVLAGIGGVYADMKTKSHSISRTVDPGPLDPPITTSVSVGAGSDARALFAGRFGGGVDYYVTRNIVINFDISYTLTTKFDVDAFNEDINLNHVPITLGVQYRL